MIGLAVFTNFWEKKKKKESTCRSIAIEQWCTVHTAALVTGSPNVVCDLHNMCNIALRMHENGSKIALNSTCSKGFIYK